MNKLHWELIELLFLGYYLALLLCLSLYIFNNFVNFSDCSNLIFNFSSTEMLLLIMEILGCFYIFQLLP